MAQALIKSDETKLDFSAEHGVTSLMLAARGGHSIIAKALLDGGAATFTPYTFTRMPYACRMPHVFGRC